MPKIDLHVHLPGTVRAETFAELAAKNDIRLPLPAPELYERINSDPTEDEADRGPWFPLLRVYEWISASLRTRDDFARVTFEAMQDAQRASDVVYSELAFSPSVHLDNGVPYADMAAGISDGIEAARRDLLVDARAIAAVNREDTPEAARAMVEEVIANPSDAVVGIGLDFDERKGLPERFVEAFALGGRHGLGRTAHASEHVRSAAPVTTCLDELGCDRIDHGYHVLRDENVLRRCREDRVVFNVAFTTSRRALRPWRRESITRMVEQGLRISLNSDDPALFPTTLEREFALATETLGEDRTTEFLANAVDAAFLTTSEKAELRRVVLPENAT